MTEAKAINAISAVVTALATVVLAAAAVTAWSQWKKTLIFQRTDDCISAVHSLTTAVDRFASLKNQEGVRTPPESEKAQANVDASSQIRQADQAMWDLYRRFNRRYHVVRRYDESLSPQVPVDVRRELEELSELKDKPWIRFPSGFISTSLHHHSKFYSAYPT